MVDFLAVSATITKVVDLIRNAVDANGTAPKWIWNVASFGVGIVAAFILDANIVGDFGGRIGEVTATIMTGLALGGSASGFHELFDLLSSKAEEADARTPESTTG